MKVKLSDAFDLQMGKTPSRNEPSYWGGTHKWVSIADMGNAGKHIDTTKEFITSEGIRNSGIKLVPKGTVIMSFKLSIGKTAITAEDMYTNEAIMAFIDKHTLEIDTDYLYYLFSGMDWTAGTNKAVLGLTLNKATLSQREINIPPLTSQLRVVEVMDKVTSLIAFHKQQLAKLDELVKSQFVDLFGDPVLNPYRWETEFLSEIGNLKNGMNFHDNDSGVELNCVGVGDFQDRYSITDTSILHKVSLSEYPSEEYMLQDGDILFVRSNGNKNLVGRSIAVYPRNVPTTFSGFCIRFRNTFDRIKIPYLQYLLRLETVRKKLTGRGANIQNLNQQALGSLSIPIPDLNLQNSFAAFVRQSDKSKFAIQRSLDKLETLKMALMEKYFR